MIYDPELTVFCILNRGAYAVIKMRYKKEVYK